MSKHIWDPSTYTAADQHSMELQVCFLNIFMLATMQSFVYPHRKKSKDTIFGDLMAEGWDQHDKFITLGNAD